MRRLARLLPLLAILVLIAVAVFVLLGTGPLAEHVRKVVQTELGKQLGRPVSIRSASLTVTGGVVLHDVVIKNKDGSVLLKAPVMAARVGGVGSLLRGDSKKVEVRSVRLERPELNLVRRPDGTWSVSDLIERAGKGPSPFRGSVTGEHARVTLVDETRGGQTTSIENADVTFKQPAQGRAEFRVRAGENEGVFESLDLRGESDTAKQLTKLSGKARSLSIPYALERIPGLTMLTAAAGTADVIGEVSLGRETEKRELHYQAEAEVKEAEISFPWLRRPVKGVAGDLELENGVLRFGAMTGTIEGAPLELKGAINGLPQAQFALDLSVTGIRYPQLRALFPRVAFPLGLLLPSPLRVTARIEGPADQIKVSGEAQVKVIKFHAIPWHDLLGKFEYQDGRLKISKLRAHGSPRQFEADIEVDLRDGVRAQGSISLTNMPLAVLAEMAGIKGEFRGIVRANIRGATIGGGELRGDFTVEGAAVEGVEFGRLAGEFVYKDGAVALRRVRVLGPTADGTLTADISLSGSYKVEARLASLDLSKVGPMLKLQGVHGRCCARVVASGRVKDGRATARVSLGPGELQGRPFDAITANAKMTREQVVISELEARSAGARCDGGLAISGWRGPAERARIFGQVRATGVALEDWMPGRAEGAAVTGTISGEAEIGGTLANPVLVANLQGESVTIAGRALAIAQGRVQYSRGHFIVEQIDLRAADESLVATGGYSPEAGIAMTIAGKQLDLAAISALGLDPRKRFGLAIAGQVDLEAKVRGTPERPAIEFTTLRVAPLTVNGEVFEELSAAGRMDGWPADGSIHLAAGSLKWKDSSISLSGSVDVASQALDLSAVLEKVKLGALLRIADTAVWRLHEADPTNPLFSSPLIKRYVSIPRPLSGRLSGTVQCAGPFAEPAFDTKFELRDFGFDNRTIQQIAGELNLTLGLGHDHRIAVRQAGVNLKASQDVAAVSVVGEVTADGQVKLKVDAGNFDLRVLNPWLQPPVEFGGQAKIDFDITGPLEHPEIIGGILVDNLQLGPFSLEAASAYPIRLERDVLAVDEVVLRNGEMEAKGQASIPTTWYGLLTTATAELHVMNASFAAMNGMEPARFDADIYLQHGRLYLRDGLGPSGPSPGVRGTMGSGEFSVSGDVGLGRQAGGQWHPAFHVTTDFRRAQVAIPGLFDVKVTGALDLRNDAEGRPLLTTEQGEPPVHRPLVISDGTVTLEKIQGAKSNLGLPFPPELKFRLAVGDNVWFQRGSEQRPTRIRVEPARTAEDGTLRGYLDIGGTMTAPGVTLAGEFESHEGQLAFPNGILTLRNGVARVTRSAGTAPVVTVSAEAEGRVGDYLVSLRPSGQIYPAETGEGGRSGPGLALNLVSLPEMEEAYVMALLKGPIVAPSLGARSDITSLLAEPTGGGGGAGQITGIRLPAFGNSLGMQELSLDVALAGPVRLRLGQRLLKRLVVSYASTLSGPVESRTLRFSYEVTPRYSVGYGVNELDQGRWEANAFIPF
jgi:hypothetical protein